MGDSIPQWGAKRILITGSRDWSDRGMIRMALDQYLHADILVSGACPTGADRICEETWSAWNGLIERHPADWSQGKSAGFRRNAHMVSLGADICLAFILNGSKGASMTADLAEKAGIRTIRYEVNN